MNTFELTQQVVADYKGWKKIGPQLEKLPADKRAVRHLVAAYRQCKIEGWLTAYLLGCIADDEGYSTVRELLLAGEAKGYAGTALARIRGIAAYDDLLNIMLTGEYRAIREAAAYGVKYLASERTIKDFVNAYQQKMLSRSTAGFHIADLQPNDELLLSLISSKDDEDKKLALIVSEGLVAENRNLQPPGKAVAKAVQKALAEGIQTMRSRKERLTTWAEEVMHNQVQ